MKKQSKIRFKNGSEVVFPEKRIKVRGFKSKSLMRRLKIQRGKNDR